MTFKETAKAFGKKLWYELNKPRGRYTFNGRYIAPEQRKGFDELKGLLETITGKPFSDKKLDAVSFSDPEIAAMGSPKLGPRQFFPSDSSGCGGSWDTSNSDMKKLF